MDESQNRSAPLSPNRIGSSFGSSSLGEIFVLCMLLITGVLYIATIPVGGGWDEETHVIRVWELARLELIPNGKPRNELPFPAIYWDLSYRRPVLIRPVDASFWEDYGKLPVDAFDYIYSELRTRSVYAPPLLLPQALIMRYLGLTERLPALPVYYLSRLAGLLAYAALVWLAVRLTPYGKWSVAVLALAPTAVFQASTIGTDPVSNGLGLLFIAGCLALSRRSSLGWWEWVAMALLSSLLFSAKVNMAFLAVLPLFILPANRFRMKGGLPLLAAAIVVLGVLEVGGWAFFAYGKFSAPGSRLDPLQQLMFVGTHPFAFMRTLMVDFAAHGVSYVREWMAEYGYGYWVVPWPTFLFYTLALFAAFKADSAGLPPPRRTRIGLLVTFLLSLVGTSLSLYVAFTPVGRSEILGLQGRYYTVIIPLLVLAFIGLAPIGRKPIPAGWTIGLTALSLGLFGVGMYLSYHVPCGDSFYELGLCYQPVYKNWAPDARYSQPVGSAMTLSQGILSECNGAAQVRVWVDSSGAAIGGSTELILREADSGRTIASRTYHNDDLPRGGWADLDFRPDWASDGKAYTLEIQADGGTFEPGPRVALSLRPEYPAGDLLVNGMPSDSDIIFKLGCQAGLERILRGPGS